MIENPKSSFHKKTLTFNFKPASRINFSRPRSTLHKKLSNLQAAKEGV